MLSEEGQTQQGREDKEEEQAKCLRAAGPVTAQSGTSPWGLACLGLQSRTTTLSLAYLQSPLHSSLPAMAHWCAKCGLSFPTLSGFSRHNNSTHRNPKPRRPRTTYRYHEQLNGPSILDPIFDGNVLIFAVLL